MEHIDNFDNIIHEKLLKDKDCENIKNNCDFLFECNDKIKNNFYFENLTDDCFFDASGAKDTFVTFYRRIIKSGVGTIILGGVNVGLNEKNQNNYARISLESNVLNKYKQICLLAHSAKTQILLKIKTNLGRFYENTNNKLPKIGSNYCLDPENGQKIVLRISDNKCNELIADISKNVLLSNISGFDGIVIDASLSNVMGELSSDEYNKRIFGYYSDSIDFLKKVLKSIDTKSNYIVLKLNLLSMFVWDKNEINFCKFNNSYFEKALAKLKLYIELGVDAFEFEFGTYENIFLNNFTELEDEFIFMDLIKKIREYFASTKLKSKSGGDIEIYYHDNIKNHSKLKSLITENIINFIDVTRNIYSDVNYLNLLKNANIVRNCLNCSHCNKFAKENHIMDCLINPELFDFEDCKLSQPSGVVAVVGAGFSGLICAITLAKRGYSVDVYEKNNHLNFYGKLTTIFGMNEDLSKYINYINHEIEILSKMGKINLFLNHKFDYKKEEIAKYLSIVVATGFKSKLLAANGAVQNHVQNIYDSLQNSKKLLSQNKIVVYVKTLLGLKLAIYLAKNKKEISIIIKDIRFLIQEKNANLFYYFNILYNLNAKIYFNSRITNINEDNLEIIINPNLSPNSAKSMLNIISNFRIKPSYKLTTIDCNLLVYEPETTPNNSLYIDIVKNKYRGEVYLVGNALENSNLAEIIKSGYFVGKNI